MHALKIRINDKLHAKRRSESVKTTADERCGGIVKTKRLYTIRVTPRRFVSRVLQQLTSPRTTRSVYRTVLQPRDACNVFVADGPDVSVNRTDVAGRSMRSACYVRPERVPRYVARRLSYAGSALDVALAKWRSWALRQTIAVLRVAAVTWAPSSASDAGRAAGR